MIIQVAVKMVVCTGPIPAMGVGPMLAGIGPMSAVEVGPTLVVSVGWALAQCHWPNGVMVQNDVGPMSGF